MTAPTYKPSRCYVLFLPLRDIESHPAWVRYLLRNQGPNFGHVALLYEYGIAISGQHQWFTIEVGGNAANFEMALTGPDLPKYLAAGGARVLQYEVPAPLPTFVSLPNRGFLTCVTFAKMMLRIRAPWVQRPEALYWWLWEHGAAEVE